MKQVYCDFAVEEDSARTSAAGASRRRNTSGFQYEQFIKSFDSRDYAFSSEGIPRIRAS